jgi:organic hydroperoxide reductase OsmC/OhrA
MLKIQVDRMRMHVTARFRLQGSVLADTIHGGPVGIETRLELESPEPPEKVARLVQTAERGCFILQSLRDPVPVSTSTLLNGTKLEEV